MFKFIALIALIASVWQFVAGNHPVAIALLTVGVIAVMAEHKRYMRCRNCGRVIRRNARACGYCATPNKG